MNDTPEEKSSVLALYLLIEKLEEIATSDRILTVEIQEEIVNFLGIIAKLKSSLYMAQLRNNKVKQVQLEAIIPNVRIAIYAIQKDSNIVLIEELRRDIEYEIRKIEYFFLAPAIEIYKNFLYRAETHTKVCFGLFAALPIHILLPFALAYCLIYANARLKFLFIENTADRPAMPSHISEPNIELPPKARLSKYDFEETSALLILSATAGAAGSVASIMLRLDEYRNPKYKKTLLPMFIGAFKPTIGAFLGIFIFALVSSNLLPITVAKDEKNSMNRWLAFMAISFVVGFSERFANDVVSKAEQIVPGGNKKSPKDSTSAESKLLIDEEKNQNQ